MLKFNQSSFFYILLGFTLYEAGKNFLYTNKLLTFFMVGMGLLLVFYNLFFRKKFYKPFTGAHNGFFYFFIFYAVFTIIRPLFFHGDSVIQMFSSFYNQYYWMAFLLPFIVFMGFKNLSLKTIYQFTFIYGIVGLLFTLLNFQQIINPPAVYESESYKIYTHAIYAPKSFLFTTSFVLLTFPFATKKHKRMAFFAMIVGLLLVTVAARRTSIFMYLIMFIFTFYLYVFKSGKRKRFTRLLFVFTLIGAGAIIFTMYSDSAFSILLTRLDADTRSGVHVAFFADFAGKPLDLIFGRGLNGTYYHPGISEGVIYRNVVETGYLYLILKGGILYLVMFLYILLHAAYKGFFKSNNRLTKGMALYIVAHVLFLYPFGLPAFSFEYVILWVSILFCESIFWRSKNDNEIIQHLNFN